MEQPQCQAECDTTVAATGNNTGIVVPDEIIEQLLHTHPHGLTGR